jgi:Arc/MetJ family transcription regulator
MRTNIDLDEKLVRRALKVSSSKTKKEVIHQALLLFVQLKERKSLRALKAKIEFSDDYDHKKSGLVNGDC